MPSTQPTLFKNLGRLLAAAVVLASSLVAASPTGAASPFSVTPSTGLIDNQAIALTGLSAETQVGICPTSAVDDDTCTFLPLDGDPASGTATTRVAARFITADTDGTSMLIDCRITSCSLRAWTYDYTTGQPILVGDVPLGFVAGAPLRPAPTLSVSPSTALIDGQSVTATASLAASDSAWGVPVFQCTQPVTVALHLDDIYDTCDVNRASFLEPSSTATAQATISVSPIVQTSNGPVDCRVAGSTCVLATFDSVFQDASAPLTFDATAPIKPALLQRPDPSTPEDPFGPPQIFDLVGFTPNDPFTVKWCNSTGGCLSGTVTSGVLSGSGSGSFLLAGDAFPVVPDDDTTCVDECMLTATDAHGLSAQGGPSFSVGGGPLEPEGPFVSDHLPVTITPNKGLHDGQMVTVRASGFTPGANVSLIQCTGTALDRGIGGCDLDTSTFLEGKTITADAFGQVTATFTIRRFLDIDGERVDCASGNVDPDAWAAGIAEDPSREATLDGQGYFSCLVGVADLEDYRHSGGAPIAFEGAVFKALPWERQTPTPRKPISPKGPVAATAVRAQPAYTG